MVERRNNSKEVVMVVKMGQMEKEMRLTEEDKERLNVILLC